MSIDEKNKIIEDYIINVSKKVNSHYNDLIDEDKISRAIKMFKNSNEDLKTEIIPKINKLVQEVIDNHLKKFKTIKIDTINLNELDYYNTFFHFTHNSNIDNLIKTNGFLPKIGEHAKGIEKTPKIFFSKGYEGVLKLADVWFKWEMNRLFSAKYNLVYKYYGIQTDTANWHEEFISDNYKLDNEKKKILFEHMILGMKKHIYFSFDLKENVDFKYSDLDESKSSLKKGSVDELYSRKFYGNYSNNDSDIMDDWNMHTLSKKKIDLENTKLIVASNGNNDCISILMEIYAKYEQKKEKQNIQFDLLTDFITYVRVKKSKLMNLKSYQI